MHPISVITFLAEEHQRELRLEAERQWRNKEALKDGRVSRRNSLRTWLGRRMISWGTRLQAGAMPFPETRRTPCMD